MARPPRTTIYDNWRMVSWIRDWNILLIVSKPLQLLFYIFKSMIHFGFKKFVKLSAHGAGFFCCQLYFTISELQFYLCNFNFHNSSHQSRLNSARHNRINPINFFVRFHSGRAAFAKVWFPAL